MRSLTPAGFGETETISHWSDSTHTQLRDALAYLENELETMRSLKRHVVLEDMRQHISEEIASLRSARLDRDVEALQASVAQGAPKGGGFGLLSG